jgi:hypothetical protein
MRRGGPHHPTLLMRAMCARRDTLLGLPVVTRPIDGDRWPATAALLRELDRLAEPAPPSSPRCLVAAGLGARPSGRDR